VVIDGSEIAPGSDGDREHNKLASLSPGIIILPTKARISMIACGLHHSSILLFLHVSTPLFNSIYSIIILYLVEF
jgi:hypothetical protein